MALGLTARSHVHAKGWQDNVKCYTLINGILERLLILKVLKATMYQMKI